MTSLEGPYDFNFSYPEAVRELENDRVKLVPFIPAQHSAALFEGTQSAPELYTFLGFGPFDTAAALGTYLDTRSKADRGVLAYAIFDKQATSSSPGSAPESEPPLAGLTGLLNADPASLSAEIGLLITAPRFQRTGLMAAAAALLMQFCLAVPAEGGLGLRRLQWQTHSHNTASAALARRMGFVLEGVIRWQRILPPGKVGSGRGVRPGDPIPEKEGRDSLMLAVCWDDWEGGVAEKTCVPGWKIHAP